MTTFEFIAVIVLHVLSGVLPTIGIGHAIYRRWKPLHDRATFIKLRDARDVEVKAADEAGDFERAESANAAYLERIHRPDKNGETLGRFGVMTVKDHSLHEKDDYENLLKDAVWVVAGVLVGVAVNIWSTVIGLRS